MSNRVKPSMRCGYMGITALLHDPELRNGVLQHGGESGIQVLCAGKLHAEQCHGCGGGGC